MRLKENTESIWQLLIHSLLCNELHMNNKKDYTSWKNSCLWYLFGGTKPCGYVIRPDRFHSDASILQVCSCHIKSRQTWKTSVKFKTGTDTKRNSSLEIGNSFFENVTTVANIHDHCLLLHSVCSHAVWATLQGYTIYFWKKGSCILLHCITV